MDNQIYLSNLNPVKFYDSAIVGIDKYQTRHFEDYGFDNRGQPWYQVARYSNIWQTTDIIPLQFSATFDPIIVELINDQGVSVLPLVALVGLPNKFLAGTYLFEVAMSLAGQPTGCYKLKLTAGTGTGQKILYSGCQFISNVAIPNTIWIDYYNSRYFRDIVFETGFRPGVRVYGYIDNDRSQRALKQEVYRNQQYSTKVLNSKSARNVPVYFGNEYGLPTDVTDLIEQIWECDNVSIDNMPFALADGAKMEFIDMEHYRMRGLHTVIEPGINKNSKAFAVTTDTTKKIMSSIIVDARAFGNTRLQGSDNTIPVYNQSIE